MPAGTWSAVDHVAHDGVGLDQPVKSAATVTITDDEMIVTALSRAPVVADGHGRR